MPENRNARSAQVGMIFSSKSYVEIALPSLRLLPAYCELAGNGLDVGSLIE